MKHATPNVQRVLVALAMCAAFVVMASVFVPLQSDATVGIDRMPTPVPRISTDPHEGLAMIGSIEQRSYNAHVYATEGGPRYTIYDAVTGEEVAAMLSAERVAELFPELPLPSTHFNAPVQMMHVDPSRMSWQR